MAMARSAASRAPSSATRTTASRKVDANVATWPLEHRFGEGLTLNNRTVLRRLSGNSTRTSSPNRLQPRDRPGARLRGYNNRNDRTNLFSQTDLVWENRLAGIDQTLLLGFEVGHEKSLNKRLTANLLSGRSVPVTDPTVDADVIFAPLASDADNRVKADVGALYVQDQIRPAAVARNRRRTALRQLQDRRERSARDRRRPLRPPRPSLVTAPRHRPQANRRFVDLCQLQPVVPPAVGRPVQRADLRSPKPLKPERFDNYEVGAKRSS